MIGSPPKGLTFSNTITLGLRISTYEFWSDTHIQFIRATKESILRYAARGLPHPGRVFLLTVTDLSTLYIYTFRSEKVTSFLAARGLERVYCE